MCSVNQLSRALVEQMASASLSYLIIGNLTAQTKGIAPSNLIQGTTARNKEQNLAFLYCLDFNYNPL